jgi:hypothetical protein
MEKLFLGLFLFSSVSAFAGMTPEATCLKAVKEAKDVGNNSQYKKSLEASTQFCADVQSLGQAECMKLTVGQYYGLENLKRWCVDVTRQEAVCITVGLLANESFTEAKERCQSL